MAASSPRKAAAPAAPRKTAAASKPKPDVEDVPVEPVSKWAQLKAEAAQVREANPVEIAPYVIDGVYGGDIVIEPPITSRQILTIATLYQADDTVLQKDARDFLAAICGDAWPRVFGLIANEDYSVMVALISDLVAHFNVNPGIGANFVEGN